MSKANNLTDFLTDIANAIRTKKEYPSTKKINPQDFASKIASITANIDGVVNFILNLENPVSINVTASLQQSNYCKVKDLITTKIYYLNSEDITVSLQTLNSTKTSGEKISFGAYQFTFNDDNDGGVGQNASIGDIFNVNGIFDFTAGVIESDGNVRLITWIDSSLAEGDVYYSNITDLYLFVAGSAAIMIGGAK